MKIFYNPKSIQIEIPIDYCQKNIMNGLCNIIVSSIEDTSWWIEGLYLNHSLNVYDILIAQENLKKLYDQKHQKMKVSEKEGIFLKDNIILNKKELVY